MVMSSLPFTRRSKAFVNGTKSRFTIIISFVFSFPLLPWIIFVKMLGSFVISPSMERLKKVQDKKSKKEIFVFRWKVSSKIME